MSNLLDDGNDLEQELTGESLGKPATGSLFLHLGLAAFIVIWGYASGFFHTSNWGDQSNGGAISVNITASIPIPSNQPPNDNVLATEHPSPAPAPPAPKTETHVDEKAIPIVGKPVKPQEKRQQKTPPIKQQPQKPVNRAQYGEQAANNLPRAMTARNNPGPTSIQQGNFGSLYGWYVNQINNKMAQTWNKFEVNPATPKGARVYLTFTINRDGSPSNARLDRSSGSPTLDRSCLNAVNRVDSFGPLPNGYNSGSLNVSYYCEY